MVHNEKIEIEIPVYNTPATNPYKRLHDAEEKATDIKTKHIPKIKPREYKVEKSHVKNIKPRDFKYTRGKDVFKDKIKVKDFGIIPRVNLREKFEKLGYVNVPDIKPDVDTIKLATGISKVSDIPDREFEIDRKTSNIINEKIQKELEQELRDNFDSFYDLYKKRMEEEKKIPKGKGVLKSVMLDHKDVKGIPKKIIDEVKKVRLQDIKDFTYDIEEERDKITDKRLDKIKNIVKPVKVTSRLPFSRKLEMKEETLLPETPLPETPKVRKKGVAKHLETKLGDDPYTEKLIGDLESRLEQLNTNQVGSEIQLPDDLPLLNEEDKKDMKDMSKDEQVKWSDSRKNLISKLKKGITKKPHLETLSKYFLRIVSDDNLIDLLNGKVIKIKPGVVVDTTQRLSHKLSGRTENINKIVSVLNKVKGELKPAEIEEEM